MWIRTHSKFFNTANFDVIDVDCDIVGFSKYLNATDEDGCPAEMTVCICLDDYSEVFNDGLKGYDDNTHYWKRWVARKVFEDITSKIVLGRVPFLDITDDYIAGLLRTCISEEKGEFANNDR